MNEIDQKIARLQEEIAALERNKENGYEVLLDNYQTYHINDAHVVLYSLDGRILGVLVDKGTCAKYLKSQEAM